MQDREDEQSPPTSTETPNEQGAGTVDDARPREVGGPKGPEPTRYGDWERNGRCYDF